MITLVNHSHVAIRAFDWIATNGEREMARGRQRHRVDEPLIPSGKTLMMRFNVANRIEAGWESWDLLSVNAVLWEDGLIDGDHAIGVMEQSLYRSKLHRLDDVLRWCDEAARLTFEDARRRLEQMSHQTGSPIVDRVLQEDLKGFLANGDANEIGFQQWRQTQCVGYAQWKRRLETLLPRQ